MKLAHVDVERTLIFEQGKGCEWIIESPRLFARYIQQLYMQSEGGTGGFVLSDGDKELDIQKNVEIISNPFASRLDDKRILNKLYGELTSLAYGEEMYLMAQELQSKLQEYIFQLEHRSPHILEMDPEPEMSALFKALDVKLENYGEDLCERLSLYIKAVTELLNKKLIVLVNIGSYLERDQVGRLIETAAYNECALLLLENQQRGFSDRLKQYIIDIDGCEI